MLVLSQVEKIWGVRVGDVSNHMDYFFRRYKTVSKVLFNYFLFGLLFAGTLFQGLLWVEVYDFSFIRFSDNSGCYIALWCLIIGWLIFGALQWIAVDPLVKKSIRFEKENGWREVKSIKVDRKGLKDPKYGIPLDKKGFSLYKVYKNCAFNLESSQNFLNYIRQNEDSEGKDRVYYVVTDEGDYFIGFDEVISRDVDFFKKKKGDLK